VAEKVTTISFERGNPSLDSFPVAQIKQCAAAILDGDANTILQYGSVAGYLPLRTIIGSWHGVGPEEVLVSNGSLQVVDFLATLLLRPGDTVFVDEPMYDRTITILRRHQANIVGVPVQADGPALDWMADKLRQVTPKFFCTIPDFQNPTGVTASLAKREEMVRLADKHDFWILEDSPYRALRYRGTEVPTMQTMRPSRVMHLSSFTKTLCPGLRVGYMVAPAGIVKALSDIVVNTYVTPGFLAQGVAYEFCRRGWLEPNIEKLKEMYRPKLDKISAALRMHVPQAQFPEPEGGFFVGLTLPEGKSTADLRERGRKVGLGLSDGRGFFLAGGGDRFLRLAFPALTVAEIEEGIGRLAELL